MTDPVDPHCSAPEDGQAPFQLRSTVDAAALARVAPQIEAILLGRLLAHRARFVRPHRPRPRLLAFAGRCAMAGLLVALAFTASGGLAFGPYRLDLLFALFFVASLALTFTLPRFEAWVRAPWPAWWRRLARRRADALLQDARAQAPFDAQYDSDGDYLTYTRIRRAGGQDVATVQWRRPLARLAVAGDGFTLFFEHEHALQPALIVLHPPSAAFDALLARQARLQPPS